MKNKILNLLCIFSLFGLMSCTELTQMKNFATCSFSFDSINEIKVLGVQLVNQNKQLNVSLADVAKLTQAITSKQLNCDFKLNLKVQNPNPQSASMQAFDWILGIDNIEITQGSVTNKTVIGAKSSSIVSLPIQVNISNLTSGDAKNTLLNLCSQLIGAKSKTSKIVLKVKPKVQILGTNLPYPNYITLEQKI